MLLRVRRPLRTAQYVDIVQAGVEQDGRFPHCRFFAPSYVRQRRRYIAHRGVDATVGFYVRDLEPARVADELEEEVSHESHDAIADEYDVHSLEFDVPVDTTRCRRRRRRSIDRRTFRSWYRCR